MVCLARFRDLLDAYVRRVFGGLDGGFSRSPSGEYICGKDVFGSGSFREGLEQYVLSEAQKQLDALRDGPASGYCFVIGDCRPAENILLDLDGAEYKGQRSKYALAERDVKIDVRSFNRAADFVFGRLFRRKAVMPHGVFAVSHTRLGSATLAMFMKSLFGSVNCRDFCALMPSDKCLVSANDEIEGAVRNKSRLNSSPAAKAIMTALRQYVEECTGMDWGR